MKNVLVSVIVCTKDRPELVDRCLTAIKKQSYKNFEIIVVASGNEANRKKTKYICKRLNAGYIEEKRSGRCIARNVGIKNAKGDLIFFFDDDTAPQEDYIEMMLKNYKSTSVAGVGGLEIPVIEESRRSAPKIESLFYSLFNPFEKNKEIGVIRPSGRVTCNFTIKESKDVMHLKGFAMSFRKNVLIRVGMFDEWYDKTAHREETDLCARIIKYGNRIVFDPSSGVYNYHREGGRPDHFNTMYSMYKQHQYFVFKNKLLRFSGLPEYLFGEVLEIMMIFVKLFVYKDWRFIRLIKSKYDGIKEGIRAKWRIKYSE